MTDDARIESLGEFVQRRRKALGIETQTRLSELSGIDLSVLNGIERNRDPNYNPRVDTVAKLARVLDVSILELLRYTAARDYVPRESESAGITMATTPASVADLLDQVQRSPLPDDEKRLLTLTLELIRDRTKQYRQPN